MVVLPLHERMPLPLLTRPLLYTALTRAKSLVILVGTDRALDACAATLGDEKVVRLDSLRERLERKAQEAGLPRLAPMRFGGDELADGVSDSLGD